MRNIGFIGVGTIAEALITGLSADGEHRANILLSPRNNETASRIVHRLSFASVAPDNQAVMDGSEIVFLALRPQVAEGVIRQLKFRADQQVVSLVAGYSVERLSQLIAPASKIYRLIPLPANANRQGAITLYPPSPDIAELLMGIGCLVQLQDERELEVVWASTALMGAYFGLMNSVAEWLTDRGVDPANARNFIAAVFHGLAVSALKQPAKSLEQLVMDHSTPGGLNEQAYRELLAAGWTDRIQEVLTLIHDRVLGRATLETKLSINCGPAPASETIAMN